MARIDFKSIIIKETDDFIIINKPPFISSLEDRNEDINILALARTYNPDAQLCHRLDKETSGALVIAKNPEAYRHMSMQFEDRKVTKLYHAVVDGTHDFNQLEYNQPIYKLSNGTVRVDKRGKEAVTIFDTIKAYMQHTLVECKPITGRMHQIRIHLSNQGAPITGDAQYGGRPFFLSSVKKKFNVKKGTEEQPLIKRLALHAHKISFKALDGSLIGVEAKPPKDFAVLIKQLDKNS